MNAECRCLEDVNAFLSGELSLTDQAEFSEHLETCSACRKAVESSRRVMAHLRALPKLECTRDLTPLILARIHERTEVTPRAAWPQVAAIAAVFAILAAALSVREWRQRTASDSSIATVEPVAANGRALDWFVRAQEADGSWSVERWGGQQKYATALTALPLLALVSADEWNARQSRAAARAAAYLLQQQNADGTFGPVFQGSPYNSSISTLALLHVWERDSKTVPKGALDAAIAALARQQTTDGGWGYHYSPLADRSISQWHVQALEFAAAHGWAEARLPVERGLMWIGHHAKALDDAEEPADSTSALIARATARNVRTDGQLDFYQAYFSATALKNEAAPVAQKRLAALRQEILRHQLTEGAEVGSWPPDDHWGRAGGRLYSTALASLALANH
ncbi:MAG TPA: zf-HC2 domain-containing protein [Chthoniobacteraceae bacterium]|nr:zf-HC2 domain-containing protein [Chthoniobacteraceae bacterium]